MTDGGTHGQKTNIVTSFIVLYSFIFGLVDCQVF